MRSSCCAKYNKRLSTASPSKKLSKMSMINNVPVAAPLDNTTVEHLKVIDYITTIGGIDALVSEHKDMRDKQEQLRIKRNEMSRIYKAKRREAARMETKLTIETLEARIDTLEKALAAAAAPAAAAAAAAAAAPAAPAPPAPLEEKPVKKAPIKISEYLKAGQSIFYKNRCSSEEFEAVFNGTVFVISNPAVAKGAAAHIKTPTTFCTKVIKHLQKTGATKRINTNECGWDACYIKDAKGKAIKLKKLIE